MDIKKALARSSYIIISILMFINIFSLFPAQATYQRATNMDINLVFYKLQGNTIGDKITQDNIKVGDEIVAKIEIVNLLDFAKNGVYSFTSAIEYDSSVFRNLLLDSAPTDAPLEFSSNIKNSIFGNSIDPNLTSSSYSARASDVKISSGSSMRRITATFDYNGTFDINNILKSDTASLVIPLYVASKPDSGQTTISITQTSPSLQANIVSDVNNLGFLSKTADDIKLDITTASKTFFIDDFTGTVPENILIDNPQNGIRTVTVQNLKGLPNVPKDTTIKVYAPDQTTLLGEFTAVLDGPVTFTLDRKQNNDSFNSLLNLGGKYWLSSTQATFTESEKVPYLVDKRPNNITRDSNLGKISDIYINASLSAIPKLVNNVAVTYSPLTGSETLDMVADIEVTSWEFVPPNSSSDPGVGKQIIGAFNPTKDNIINTDGYVANATVDVLSFDAFDPLQDIIISADDPRNTLDLLNTILPSSITGTAAGNQITINGVQWSYIGDLNLDYNAKGSTYNFQSNVTNILGEKAVIKLVITPVIGKLPNIPTLVEIRKGTQIDTFDQLVQIYLPTYGNLILTGNIPVTTVGYTFDWMPNKLPDDFNTQEIGKEWPFKGTASYTARINNYPDWLTFEGPNTADVVVKIVRSLPDIAPPVDEGIISPIDPTTPPATRDNSIIGIASLSFLIAISCILIIVNNRKSKDKIEALTNQSEDVDDQNSTNIN